MNLFSRFYSFLALLAAGLALGATSCFAAATLVQKIEPAEANVGDPITVTITVQNGTIKGNGAATIFGMVISGGEIPLPPVEGLERGRTETQTMSINGSSTTTANFTLIPVRPGDFTIPAFVVQTQEGDVLHVKAMKLHVLGLGAVASGNKAPNPAVSSAAPAAVLNPPANANGPVVMPPVNPPSSPDTSNNGDTANDAATNPEIPRDTDGGPAKVFIVITPQTTDAYIGQSIPMQIDFYIRMDVNAEQNSLPTIKGSNFLMNNFTTRGHLAIALVEGQQFERETWITAISAPKSGDFPLSMERDTYWIKSITNDGGGIFGFFNRRANLAHESIGSNQLTMNVHDLPTEGRPAHFTGAIGKFQVGADAQPLSVTVGEPVTLRFSVSGEGNFDYVRCPALTDSPAWKSYTPKSGTNYVDESHTHAVKSFEQSIIPQKGGTLPLPGASFSYFDPTAKNYVTVPITLPPITVSGSPNPIAAAAPAGTGTESESASIAPPVLGFLPNRVDLGSPQKSLVSAYRQPWFWGVQAGLIALPLCAAVFLWLRPRDGRDNGAAERASRRLFLQQEEDAMAEAVRQDDAVAFFVAARHAVQLQLGAQWKLKPEAITLGEIRERDPQLAETLEPLFAQADEVIYSGQASSGLDLAQWDQVVRTELLQPQPA